jgi:predicted Fe-Mo cluster-binding NifX family protein
MTLGEHKCFVGGEEYLKQRGIEVVVLESKECIELMSKFIKEKPEDWYVPVLGVDPRINSTSGMKILARLKSEFMQVYMLNNYAFEYL